MRYKLPCRVWALSSHSQRFFYHHTTPRPFFCLRRPVTKPSFSMMEGIRMGARGHVKHDMGEKPGVSSQSFFISDTHRQWLEDSNDKCKRARKPQGMLLQSIWKLDCSIPVVTSSIPSAPYSTFQAATKYAHILRRRPTISSRNRRNHFPPRQISARRQRYQNTWLDMSSSVFPRVLYLVETPKASIPESR